MTASLAAAGIAIALLTAGVAAGAQGLGWLLAPTAALAGLFSGVPFEPSAAGGYVNAEHGIAIGRSCAGLRFFTMAYVLGVLSTLPRLERTRSRWIALAGVLCGAYLVAVLANASRIAGAMLILRLAGGRAEPAGSVLHLAEGMAVFSSSLVLFSLALQRAMRRSCR